MLASLLKRDDWDAITPVDVMFVDHDGHRSYRFGGKAYAPLIDSIQETYLAQGKRCLTIAEPFSKMTGDAAFGRVTDVNGSFVRAAVRRVLMNKLAAPERVRGTRYIRDVWLEILKRARPSEVIAIQPPQALCSACRQVRIPVADLQHGVINAAHPWYGRSFREGHDRDGLPTSFLCWDDTSAETVRTWALPKGISVQVIGNPWLRRFMVQDPADALVSEALKDCSWLSKVPRQNRILVTLAWGSSDIPGVDMPHYLSFPTPLLDIMRQTRETSTWFVRPHPVQMRNNEGADVAAFLRTNLGDVSNVFCNEVASVALPVLLQATDVHLTISSTVTSEAASFGVPTGLVAPNPRPPDWLDHYFEDERAAGVAEFVPNTTEGLRRYLASKLPDLYQGRSATTRNASQP